MNQIFQVSFWFDAFPLPFTTTAFWILLCLFLAGLALGFVGLFFQTKFLTDKLVKKLWLKLTSFGFSFGLAGLVLFFLKYQRIPYLGMRLWLILWLLACVIWFGFIVKYIIIDLPKAREEKKQKEQLLKYIP